jgi:hypothetical protein
MERIVAGAMGQRIPQLTGPAHLLGAPGRLGLWPIFFSRSDDSITQEGDARFRIERRQSVKTMEARQATGSGRHAVPYGRLTYVVGHSRGGTTWLGELLACHSAVRYLFEPFASQAHPCTGIDMQTVFNGGRFILRGKVGRPVADIPIPQFFRGPSDDPSNGLLPALAASHLAELARRTFGGDLGSHLVVKQPRIENVAWASAAIRADHVIALDRHPFGVVHSVRRWGMLNWARIEWAILQRDETLSADTRELVRDAQSPEERLLVTSWLRSRHLREFAARHAGVTLIDYETLCQDPAAETARLWSAIGLEAAGAEQKRLATFLAERGDGEDRRARFLNVRKDPLSRQHAWRHELPRFVRRRLESFVRRHRLPIPLPGAGLPDLSASERRLARRADLLGLGGRCRRLAADAYSRIRAKAA